VEPKTAAAHQILRWWKLKEWSYQVPACATTAGQYPDIRLHFESHLMRIRYQGIITSPLKPLVWFATFLARPPPPPPILISLWCAETLIYTQCCGSGSGIGCFFDPGWEEVSIWPPGSGSGSTSQRYRSGSGSGFGSGSFYQ
jgi:hypothetical protein